MNGSDSPTKTEREDARLNPRWTKEFDALGFFRSALEVFEPMSTCSSAGSSSDRIMPSFSHHTGLHHHFGGPLLHLFLNDAPDGLVAQPHLPHSFSAQGVVRLAVSPMNSSLLVLALLDKTFVRAPCLLTLVFELLTLCPISINSLMQSLLSISLTMACKLISSPLNLKVATQFVAQPLQKRHQVFRWQNHT